MKMKYEAAEMARQSAELDSKTAKAPSAAMVAAAQAITKQRKPSNDDFSRSSSQRKLNQVTIQRASGVSIGSNNNAGGGLGSNKTLPIDSQHLKKQRDDNETELLSPEAKYMQEAMKRLSDNNVTVTHKSSKTSIIRPHSRGSDGRRNKK